MNKLYKIILLLDSILIISNSIYYKYNNLDNDKQRLEHEYNIYDENDFNLYKIIKKSDGDIDSNENSIIMSNEFCVHIKKNCKIIKIILFLHRINRNGFGNINLEIKDNIQKNYLNIEYNDKNSKAKYNLNFLEFFRLDNLTDLSFNSNETKNIINKKIYYIKKYGYIDISINLEYSCLISTNLLKIEYSFINNENEIYKIIVPFEKYYIEGNKVYITDKIIYTFEDDYNSINFEVNIKVGALLNTRLIKYIYIIEKIGWILSIMIIKIH